LSSLFVLLFGYKIIVKSLQKYSHYDRLILRIEEVAVDMHTEVFNNIDTLIEMAGASLKNMDEVNAELITLKRQIRNKNNEIEDFKSIINDARYFNASNELVDKNIEISLKNKITRLKRKIKDIDNNGKALTTNEEALHEEIKDLKNKIAKNEKYVNVLEVKTNSNLDNNYYISMLDTERNNILELKTILDNKTSLYNDILKELELNNQAKDELSTKLSREEERLNDVMDNLTNPNTYIDEDLKKSDEDRLNALENELDKLQKRELELLTDASVIGADAKELIATNDANAALQKIKELVTIVKTKPYMDINNAAILDEELEKKESLRIELAGLIDSKNYEGINSEAIKERIDYLNKEVENNNEQAAKLKNEISNIDEHISSILGKKISDLEKEIIDAEKIVQNYKNLIKAKDNASKTRTNLEQAILKKQKEIQVLDNILIAYKETLVSKINDTNKLNERVSSIENDNSRYLKELDGLQKITLINFKTKDLVEEEKDREDLRNLNEEIKQIKIRKQFDRSPNEIYDQIEMALASVTQVSSSINIQNVSDDIISTSVKDEVKENDLNVNPEPQIEIVNEIIEPMNQDVSNIENLNNIPKIDDVITNVIDEVLTDDDSKKEIIPENSNRIKVVKMIPVETVKKSGGNA
jgi:predicted  nucleic acid-binding Zn-ribbon protein